MFTSSMVKSVQAVKSGHRRHSLTHNVCWVFLVQGGGGGGGGGERFSLVEGALLPCRTIVEYLSLNLQRNRNTLLESKGMTLPSVF